MRKNSEPQRPLAPVWPNHRLSDELRTISKILDKIPRSWIWFYKICLTKWIPKTVRRA